MSPALSDDSRSTRGYVVGRGGGIKPRPERYSSNHRPDRRNRIWLPGDMGTFPQEAAEAMNSPTYRAFEPRVVDTVVIGCERIADMEDELRALHEQHYNETETLYLSVPFDPDYERYKEVEERGQFVVFTVRILGVMVGYLQYYVFRDMHSQHTYQAREDALFLTKEHRGRNLAPMLLDFAEHCLGQLGCKYVGMSSKAPAGGPDIGRFLERKGYAPVATYYVKQLETQDVLQRPAATA